MDFPNIDPVIFSIGPLSVHWYGLMYVIAFFTSYMLVKVQAKRHNFTQLEENIDNLNTVLIICVILGGRLGYVLFYNLAHYIKSPMEIVATWNGGMSFHGACALLIVGGFIYCRKQKLDFWKTADIYVATVPLGLAFGRIGNFINGELYGRVTDVPWGVVFPYGGTLPRHPSQLYEAFLEGVILFIVLWSLRNKPWQNTRFIPHGSILAFFLIGYGLLRSFVENFRQPDAQLGFVVGQITMGQVLSGSMIIFGLILWAFRIHQSAKSR